MIPVPTCADDIALMATDPVELQFSQEMRYELQPKKTSILIIGPDDAPCEFLLHLYKNRRPTPGGLDR